MYPKVKVEMTDERNETIHLFDYNITRFASIFFNIWVYFCLISLITKSQGSHSFFFFKILVYFSTSIWLQYHKAFKFHIWLKT